MATDDFGRVVLRAVFTPRRQGGEIGLAGTDLLEKAFHEGINFEL